MRMGLGLVLGLAMVTVAAGPLAADEAKVEKVKIGPAVYEVPSTWQRQQPTNTMRVVQFGVPLAEEDMGKVEFVVFYFQGQGGGVEENLKRWIGMFQDVQGKEKKAEKEVSGLKITTLDISGTYKDKPFPMSQDFTPRKDYRMLAAVVETPDDGPYFFRFVGPKKTIAAQEAAWNHMLETVSTKK